MLMLKRFLSISLLAASLSAQTGPATAAASPAVKAESANPWLPPLTGGEDATVKKARALLTQMIEAMGGQNYFDIRSFEQTGMSYAFYNGKPNSLGTEFYRIVKFPDKERSELTKKRDVVYIENGDQGYEVTYKGTSLQDPKSWHDYVRRRNFSLDSLLRDWLKCPGTQMFYEGTAIAEQRMADVVSLVNAQNESASIFIDQTTHLPIKKTFVYRDPLDKQKDEEGEIYGNWRIEGGLNTPHSIVRTHNGDYTNQRFIKTITFNVPAPDSLFTAKVTFDPYVLERRLDPEQKQK
jgi:hypothetical protein